MITVTQLVDFDPLPYQLAAAGCVKAGIDMRHQAEALRDKARGLRSHWESPAAQMASIDLYISADECDGLASQVDDSGTIVGRTAKLMVQFKSQMIAVKDLVFQLPMSMDDHGHVDLGFWGKVLQVSERQRLYYQGIAMLATQRARAILLAADATLRSEELALQALTGYATPTPIVGPIDLDDESILAASAINQQDKHGDCVWLSTLQGLAQADPDFVRRHMIWDAEHQTYIVTIYDDKGNPQQVTVDPTNLPSDGAQAYGSGKPTWLSVYEEALRQKHAKEVKDGLVDTSVAATVVTGVGAKETTPRTTSFDDIRAILGTTPPGTVVVSTTGSGRADGPPEGRLAPDHAYRVKGFDADGKIILTNPWGPAGGFLDGKWYPGEVHLTEAEYEQQMKKVASATPPYK